MSNFFFIFLFQNLNIHDFIYNRHFNVLENNANIVAFVCFYRIY